MTFNKENYYEETFKDQNVSTEIIKETEFEDCHFINCSFLETKFINCHFITCTFENCSISTLDITGSHLNDVNFMGSKVIGIDWTKTTRIQDLNFDRSQISYSNFRMLKLPRIKINECDAKDLDFTESDLKEAILTNTDFEKTIFFKTNLTKADMRGAKNYFIDIHNNTLTKAQFSYPEALSLLSSLNITIS